MRQSIHKISQHNLASSKRSIVIAVAGLALLMGTTSAGTVSLFSRDKRPVDNVATNPLTDLTTTESREVPLGWPAFTILQGQNITPAQPTKTESGNDTRATVTELNISPGSATIILESPKAAESSSGSDSTEETPAADPAATEQPAEDNPSTPPETPSAEEEDASSNQLYMAPEPDANE